MERTRIHDIAPRQPATTSCVFKWIEVPAVLLQGSMTRHESCAEDEDTSLKVGRYNNAEDRR